MIAANLLHPGTPSQDEVFEDILKRPGLRIERIVSRGHTTPADKPYVQSWDEWVLVIQGSARLLLEEREEQLLETGAHLLIPCRNAPLGCSHPRSDGLAGHPYRRVLRRKSGRSHNNRSRQSQTCRVIEADLSTLPRDPIPIPSFSRCA